MRPRRMVLVLLCALAALVATALPNSAGGAVVPASLRLAVATAGGSSVDLAVDGHVRAARIGPATASAWQTLKPGTHAITVLDRHHAVLARVSLRLASGNRRTVVLLSSGSTFHLLVVAETTPAPGTASVVVVDGTPAASGAAATLAGHFKTLATGHAVTISASPGDDGAALPLAVGRGTSTLASAHVDPIGGALSVVLLVARAGHLALVALPRPAAAPAQAAPTVQGAARVGSDLACQPVGVRYAATTAYAWLVDDVATGDHAASRTTLAADAGHAIACRATIAGPGGTLARRSPALDIPAPPALSITAASTGDTLLTDASVSWTTLGAVEETTCSLNGAAPTACASPLLLSGLVPGAYTVAVTASGPGGVVHATTGTWSVVATPTVTITSPPPPAVTAADAVEITYTVTSGAVVTCVIDAGPCAATFTGLPTGHHVVTITASGNGAADTKVVEWTQVPFLTLVSGPPAHTTADAASVTVSTNGTAACALDGVLPGPCAAVTGLAAGAHDLAVTAAGNDGTTATPLTVHWVVDPTVAIAAPPSPTTDASPTIAFTTTPASGVTTTCALDGAAPPAPCPSPVVYSQLGLGQHTLVVTATGPAETTAATASVTWLENPPAPTVAITSAPAARSTETTARITYLPSGVATTTSCTLDGSALTPCPTSLKLDGVAAGAHTFSVTVDNVSGQNAASTTWIVDPTVTITTPPADPTIATSASIAYTTTPATGLTTTCALDGAAHTPCVSPITVSGLALGSHVVTVTVTGGVGSAPASASATWLVNPPAPTVTITSQTPTAIAFSTTSVVTTRTCTLDASTAPCTSPFTLANLASGTHAFSVTVGNVTGSSTAVASPWVVQHAVAISSSPATPTTATTATIAFAATPPAGVTYVCTLDGGASAACTSPATYTGLKVRSHAFSVTATGGAGSTPATASVSWVQNPPAPTVAITSAPPARTTATTASVAWGAAGTVGTTTCTLDGVTLASCTSPIAATVASGTHAVAITVANVSGQNTATATWVVDPTVTITTPPTDSIATSASIAYTTTPASGLTVTCTLNGSAHAPCASPITLTGLAVGTYTVAITAAGAPASQPATTTATWKVLPPVPTVSITSPAAGGHQTATSAQVTFTLGGGPASTVTCQVDAATATACTSPYTASLATSGTHTVTVVAASTAGSATASTTITLDPTVSFVITPANPTTSRGGLIGWSTGPTTLPATCTLDGAPFTPCIVPVSLPTLAYGSHTFAVTVTGGAGATPATATYAWRVQPILTVVIAGSAGAGGTVSSPALATPCTAGTCTAGVDVGTTVVLTAAANATSLLTGFTGCVSSTATTCTLLLDAPRTVQVAFVPANVRLTVAVAGAIGSGGTVTSADGKISCPGTCSATYPYNSAPTLTATPDALSTFSTWAGACSTTALTCSPTLTADSATTAVFALRHYQITVTTNSLTTTNIATGNVTSNAGHSCLGDQIASVTCSASVAAGTPLTLTAAPASDSQVATWGGTPCATGATTCTFTPTGDLSINVNFTLALHTLTLHVIGTGSVTDSTNTIVGCTAATSPCTGLFPHYADEFLAVTTPAGTHTLTWSGSGGAPTCNQPQWNNPCQVTTIGDIDVTVTITP